MDEPEGREDLPRDPLEPREREVRGRPLGLVPGGEVWGSVRGVFGGGASGRESQLRSCGDAPRA